MTGDWSGTKGRQEDAARSGPILLVDDEPYVLRWLAWHLTREGYRVETASDGEVGLARARELHPPLIFLDVRLPLLDGYTLCAEIRRDPALAGTHVTLLSAGERLPAGDRSDGDGAPDDYLFKPCRPREVTRLARAVLGAPHGAHGASGVLPAAV
jgi:two-component system, OmpR family, alkaline phosphatase synthesis response regulator PhoP